MVSIQDVGIVLDERQRVILQAIVEEHVRTSRPVASGSVVRRAGLGVSSATVRNEFAILEDLNLIEQPHTSAGRVPSDSGYRVYVDDLLPIRATSTSVRESLQAQLAADASTLRSLLACACRALCGLTGYTALVMIPTVTQDTMRHLQLGSVDADSVLVLFVTLSGRTEHRVFRLQSHKLSAQRLSKINAFLDELLSGMSLPEIRKLDVAEALRGQAVDPCAEQILDLVRETIPDDESQEVFVEGVVCLLAEPEFQSTGAVRPVVEALEEPATAAHLLSAVLDDEGAHVVIGSEHEVEPVRQCSFVGARYEAGSALTGGLGIIGPRRMRYSEALPLVEAVAEELSGSIAHA